MLLMLVLMVLATLRRIILRGVILREATWVLKGSELEKDTCRANMIRNFSFRHKRHISEDGL